MKRPTVKIARRTDGGGIELRVTADRRMRRYGLGYTCENDQWNAAQQRFTARMPDAASKNRALGEVLATVGRILDRLLAEGAWEWSTFDRLYRNGGEQLELAAYLRTIEQEHRHKDRLGNAGVYRYAASVVDRYTRGRPLPLAQLHHTHLLGIDRMLRVDGAQDTGVGFVMRTIRAGVNRAMREGLLPPERYPFATRRTQGYDMASLRQRSVPRALNPDELERLKAFDLVAYPQYATAVLLWLWSYYARGMSWVDMAHLRTTDVVAGRIYYRRRKTITKVDRVLTMPLTEPLQDILAQLGPSDGGWLLPIFTSLHRTPQQQRHRRMRQLGLINKDLRAVGELLGFAGKLTTYVARHTYATTLNRNAVQVTQISEALGHSNVRTTAIYLARFGDGALDRTDELL